MVLNEVMSNNTKTLADEDGEFVDWIELHNRGNDEVSLDGFGLSDNPSLPLKWQFAAGTNMPAGGYLVVHLSGKDRPGGDTAGPHTSFRLSNGREPVIFSNPAGVTLDRIYPGSLRSDDSLGRNVDDPLAWHEFDGSPPSTPGAPNTPSGGSLSAPYVQPPGFTAASGFYDAPVQVTLQPAHPGDLVFYTTDGSDPDEMTSERADSPVVFEATTVVRAITVTAGGKRKRAVDEHLLCGRQPTRSQYCRYQRPQIISNSATAIFTVLAITCSRAPVVSSATFPGPPQTPGKTAKSMPISKCLKTTNPWHSMMCSD